MRRERRRDTQAKPLKWRGAVYVNACTGRSLAKWLAHQVWEIVGIGVVPQFCSQNGSPRLWAGLPRVLVALLLKRKRL